MIRKTAAHNANRKTSAGAAGVAAALLLANSFAVLPATAASKSKTAPAGTMLIPLAPKLDGDSKPVEQTHGHGSPYTRIPLDADKIGEAPAPKPQVQTRSKPMAQASAPTPAPKIQKPVQTRQAKAPVQSATAGKLNGLTGISAPQQAQMDEFVAPEKTAAEQLHRPGLPVPLPEKANAETLAGEIDVEDEDNILLKGTVSIVADDTEYDQNRNTFLGTGNAVATIAGQDSRLEADVILYDQNSQTIDARGNVKILRAGQLSTGSAFKFKVNSDEYLLTDPDTEVNGTQVIARTGYGTKDGLGFKNGTMSLPQPIYIARNPFFGTMQSSEESMNKTMHPDAYLPSKPSFTFKARKMVYEQYKEAGNLTVFGGKMMFGKFGIPVGKLNATIGKDSNVTFPVTPIIGNNIQVGGVNIGPSFNHQLTKYKTFSWAPLVQIGGRQPTAAADKGTRGLGARISYRGQRSSANLAYGSVSNLLVGDYRYQFNPSTVFQAGINRFMPDGMFGSRRPRFLAEVVNQRGVGGIPFLTGISFRSSAGYASDQPSLVNVTPEYAQLFKVTNGNIANGYRLQEQIMTTTEPVFYIGDRKYGASLNFFGGVSARAYSSGDSMLMAQGGPVLGINLDRVRLAGTLFKSGVQGKSPFVFDQFIQGSKAAQLNGDVRICKWLTVGGNFGYNMDAKMLFQRSIAAAIGPEDFKLLITRDTIRGINRFGFDMLYGKPIPFDKLVLKGNPDRGQLGGI